MQSLVGPRLVRASYLTAEDGAVPAKLHSSPTAKMAMKTGKEDAEPLGKKKAASITRKLPRVDQAAAGEPVCVQRQRSPSQPRRLEVCHPAPQQLHAC